MSWVNGFSDFYHRLTACESESDERQRRSYFCQQNGLQRDRIGALGFWLFGIPADVPCIRLRVNNQQGVGGDLAHFLDDTFVEEAVDERLMLGAQGE